MQAMLMAFITMNMNNSGIPSTKANSISRTVPPLFTIKISEEEKIAEDLHKIKIKTDCTNYYDHSMYLDSSYSDVLLL